jgi:hypothetical protein
MPAGDCVADTLRVKNAGLAQNQMIANTSDRKIQDRVGCCFIEHLQKRKDLCHIPFSAYCPSPLDKLPRFDSGRCEPGYSALVASVTGANP